MSQSRKYHHGDLARVLREATTRLVHDHGSDGFSLRQAAREAGVDPAAVYRHFRDKDALLSEVSGEGFGRLRERMSRALAEVRDPTERLRVVGRAYIGFAQEEPEIFRLMFGPSRGEHGRTPTSSGPTAYDLLKDALGGMPAGGWSLDEAALACWSIVHGLASLLIDGPLTDPDPEAATELVLDMAIAALGSASFPTR